MAGNFSIEVEESGPGISVELPGIAARQVAHMRDVAEGAAKVGAAWMRWMAPKRSSDLANAVTSTDAVWHPGGLGGGGYWEAETYISEEEEDKARWVFEGTGIFKDGATDADRIYPSTGNILAFMHNGHMVFARSVKGQEPQTEWVTGAQEAADFYVDDRMNDSWVTTMGITN